MLAATFLPTIRNDIVVLIIWEEFIDRDVVDLIVARMIPSDSHDVQRDTAINELLADVWSFKATSTRHKQLVQLKELMKLEKVFELEDPSQLRHWV